MMRRKREKPTHNAMATTAIPAREETPIVQSRMMITSMSWMMQVQLEEEQVSGRAERNPRERSTNEKWKKEEAKSMREIEVEMWLISLALLTWTRAFPDIRIAFRSAGSGKRQ